MLRTQSSARLKRSYVVVPLMAVGNNSGVGGGRRYMLGSPQARSRRWQSDRRMPPTKQECGTLLVLLPPHKPTWRGSRSLLETSTTGQFVKSSKRHFRQTRPLDHFTTTRTKKHISQPQTRHTRQNVFTMKCSHLMPGFVRMQRSRLPSSTAQLLNTASLAQL